MRLLIVYLYFQFDKKCDVKLKTFQVSAEIMSKTFDPDSKSIIKPFPWTLWTGLMSKELGGKSFVSVDKALFQESISIKFQQHNRSCDKFIRVSISTEFYVAGESIEATITQNSKDCSW